MAQVWGSLWWVNGVISAAPHHPNPPHIALDVLEVFGLGERLLRRLRRVQVDRDDLGSVLEERGDDGTASGWRELGPTRQRTCHSRRQ